MLPVPRNVFVAGFCDVVLKRCEYTRRLNKFTDFGGNKRREDISITTPANHRLLGWIGGGCTHAKHGRSSRLTTASNIRTMPVRSLSGFTDQRSGWAVPNLVYGLQIKGSYDTAGVKSYKLVMLHDPTTIR